MKTQIDHNALTNLKNGDLFYPMSGSDIDEPVSAFHRYISTFWFCDINYDVDITPLNPRRRRRRPLPTPNNQKFKRVSKVETSKLHGTTITSQQEYEIEIYSRKYQEKETEKVFTVNYCKGKGYNCFRSIFKLQNKKMDIFFYRGDSQGEGGSGFYFLRHLGSIIPLINDNGLIVTDGSNGCSKYNEMSRFNELYWQGNWQEKNSQAALNEVKSFKVKDAELIPISYLEPRYGPTLIWKVFRGFDVKPSDAYEELGHEPWEPMELFDR